MVRFGLDVATEDDWAEPAVLVELAVAAEEAGWDGFFPWDIMRPDDPSTPVADAWSVLAAVAARTTRIRLGAMVTPLPRLQPWEVARRVAMVDRLSGGRVIFGAGLGWKTEEYERVGLVADPAQRAGQLDEGLKIVADLWTGEPVSYSGRHYTLSEVQLRPTPFQRPRPPIWLGAGWPRLRPLRRAIDWDGVYLMTNNQATNARLSPTDVREVARFVAEQRQTGAPFDIAANISTADDTEAELAMASQLATAGATWLVELTRGTIEEHRARIRRGPPRIHDLSGSSPHGGGTYGGQPTRNSYS